MKFALTATFALLMVLCSPLLLWLILTDVTEGAYKIYSRTTALRTKMQSAETSYELYSRFSGHLHRLQSATALGAVMAIAFRPPLCLSSFG
jgi:hypothetical protein